MFKKKKKTKSIRHTMWQSATEYCLLIQRMSCQDETKLPPPLLPPTAAPLNRHLQNRDFGEPDPDGPAVKVTRAASHSSDSYWLHQSQRNANHTCQGVLPAGSQDIPLPAQGQERWRLALTEVCKRQSGSPLLLCSQFWLPLKITCVHVC